MTKKKILALLLAVLMVVSLLPTVAFAEFEEAGGTEAAPYQIGTLDDLNELATEVNGGKDMSGKFFKLTADIGDATTAFTTPIGNYTNQFKGNFDGDGHTVTLNISGSSYLGLFGCINGGSIKNVTTAGTVADTSKSVTGNGPVAGVCALNIGGTIENCVNKAAVSCSNYGKYMGGICGENEGGTINGCSNTAQVKAWGYNAQYFGGICGQNYTGSILNCVNSGEVKALAYDVNSMGGICGLNGGVDSSAATADAIIANCVNNGKVTVQGNSTYEAKEIGGICGRNNADTHKGMVVNCFSTAVMSYPVSDKVPAPVISDCGGVVGYNWEKVDNGKAIVSNCYYDTTVKNTLATATIGSTNFQHVTDTLGMTTAQMKAASGETSGEGWSGTALVNLLNGYKDGGSYPTAWEKWKVADGNYPTFAVATVKIGENSYVTLAEALADAQNGDEIKLTQDMTLDSAITIPEGKNITIDLNGFKLDRGLSEKDSAANGSVIVNNGTLTIKDSSNPSTGTITGGNATFGGAIVSNGTTTLESGTITGCKATSTEYDSTNSKLGRGGAVYVPYTGTFNMSGGEIKDCSASVAGGAIFNIGTVNITGGKIDGCSVSGVNDGGTVKAKGGAVYNFATSHFTMTGGEISGNTLGNVADMRGAGVYAASNAIVTLGGTAKITDNTNGDNKASNLFLYDGVKFAISTNKAPETGMNVGVTTKTAPTTSNSVQIGTTTTDYSSFFFADNSSYSVVFDGNNNVLELAFPAVNVKEVDVKENVIKAGDSTVTVKDADGQNIESENLEKVSEAINEVLDNEKVKNVDETGLEEATKNSNDAIVDALKAKTDDDTAKGNINQTGISKYLNVNLVSANVDVDATVTVTSMVFDVTPMATITVIGSDGEVTLTTEITKDEISGDVTFLLPVDKSIEAKTAAVYHEGKFLGNYDIKTDNGNKYIEVTTDSFSEFGYITLDETTAGAKIGTTLYASLSDAIDTVNSGETIELLKDASGTITVSREVSFTLTLNEKQLNATIQAGTSYKMTEASNVYTFEKAPNECEYKKTEKLAEGTFGLKLGGKDKGKFTFAQVDDGWSIKNADGKFLAMKDGKLSLSDEAFAWTYKNGAFSADEKVTTTKTSTNIFAWLFSFGRKSITTTTTVTEIKTFYLSDTTDGAKLSTKYGSAELYVEVAGEHDYGCWIDCEDGNHKHICKNCGKEETEECVYDEITHKCICGAYDPAKANVKISVVDVKTKTTKQFSGFLFWGTWKNVTTYTATIKTEATGVKVKKVEYQLNGSSKWITGTCVSSDKPIETLKVKAWDSKGNKHEYEWPEAEEPYTYANGLYSVCNLLNPTEEKAIGVEWQTNNDEYSTFENCSTKEKIAEKEQQNDLLCIKYCGVGENKLSDYIDALKQKLGEEKVVKNDAAGLYQITYNKDTFIVRMLSDDLLIVFDTSIFDS